MRKSRRASLLWVAIAILLTFSPAQKLGAVIAQEDAQTATNTKYGVHASSGRRPDAVSYVADLGAGWVRLNSDFSDPDPDFKSFLDAGINVIITITNRDPANIDTTYGSASDWIHAGFPYRSREAYQQRIRSLLAPLLGSLTGREVWVQCENEIGDVLINPNSVYWRGTTDQYLSMLQACYEAVKAMSAAVQVVLTSFASANLDAVVDPANPGHDYQTQRMTRLLSEGQYDAADLHFYGCVDGIPARAAWVKSHLPSGRRWISTENSGPVASQCRELPITWQQDLSRFEQVEAQQVPLRLRACSDAGASVCLWFSLLDLRGEVDDFNHLGVLDSREEPPRKKPAYDAFKSFVGSQSPGPVLASVEILRRGVTVDHLVAGAKTKLYQINLGGSGFSAGAVAVFGGSDAETTVVSSTALTTKPPGKRVGAAGTVSVQVHGADGQLSNAMSITILDQ
jgi:hypothetical protein